MIPLYRSINKAKIMSENIKIEVLPDHMFTADFCIDLGQADTYFYFGVSENQTFEATFTHNVFSELAQKIPSIDQNWCVDLSNKKVDDVVRDSFVDYIKSNGELVDSVCEYLSANYSGKIYRSK